MENGFDVVVVDNLSNSKKEVLNRIGNITGKLPEFERIDLCDAAALHNFFLSPKAAGIQAVIHFAAFKNVGESVKNPLKYYQNNLFSLINLLSEMKNNNIDKLVFSSSCSVYGNPSKIPVTENAPLQPAQSPYGNTKKMSEEIIRDFALSESLKTISLRYFNPIGAHPSCHIGEFPSEFMDNIVPALTKAARHAGTRHASSLLCVYGNDYNTPDGTCIRDYIDITDLSRAHLTALNRLASGEIKNTAPFEVYNLGTGKGVSVLEIIHAFERVTGQKINYKIVERRRGDVEAVYADPSLANKVLGWKVKKNLDKMIRTAWAWEKAMETQRIKSI